MQPSDQTENLTWQVLATEPIWRGYRKLDRVRYLLPSGQEADFEIKREGEAVCVLALTPKYEVVLTRQYRPGPAAVLLELPGGAVDAGESLQTAMERELLEETGYQGTLSYVGSCWIDAYSTTKRHHFIATDCEQVGELKEDPLEPIEVVRMTLPQFREHLRSGQLTDMGSAYACLDYLERTQEPVLNASR